MIRDQKTVDEFESRMVPEPTSGCWLWTRPLNSVGYGRFGNDMAHRASWVLYVGQIPKGFYVLHKCDVKSCVNPEHLEIGTQRKNIRDARERKGVGVQKLMRSEVEEIIELYASGKHSQSQIGRMFGVCQQNVSWIVNGGTWQIESN